MSAQGFGQFIKPTAVAFAVTNSLQFDGSTKYLYQPQATAFNIWELSLWVKRGAVGSNQILFGYQNSAGTDDAFIGFNSADKIWIYSAGASVYSSGSFSSTSQWMHIFATLDLGGICTVWVNRTQVAQMASGFIGIPASGGYNYIGLRPLSGGSFFNGLMAEVAFSQVYPLTDYNITTTAGGVNGALPKAFTLASGSGMASYLNFKDSSGPTTTSNVGIGKTVSGDLSSFWRTPNFVTADVKTVVPP